MVTNTTKKNDNEAKAAGSNPARGSKPVSGRLFGKIAVSAERDSYFNVAATRNLDKPLMAVEGFPHGFQDPVDSFAVIDWCHCVEDKVPA